jgi:type III secretion protein N (ATPase)
VRRWISRYQEVELLLQIGEYRRGNDVESDLAIDRHLSVQHFLRQPQGEYCDWNNTMVSLHALCDGAGE